MKSVRKVTALIVCITLAACAFSCLAGCSLFAKASPDIQPHLISEENSESEPRRPIDSLPLAKFEKTTVSEQLDELLDMVYKPERGSGYRPDLDSAHETVAEIYRAAVKVLDRYVLNDFSEFERVHAVHDYLAYFVEYDLELAGADSVDSSDPAFGLEGVFLNGKAVCDGISKAFNLLCGIEQISCIRVTGRYGSGADEVNHAWNKVRVDGAWYNVDATMDSWHVVAGGKEPTSVLNHGYFLVSDEDISATLTGRHVEDPNLLNNRDCPKSYEFYSTVSLGIGDYSMEIASQAQLNDVFSRIKKSKRKIGKVELRLNFPEQAVSNLERPDAYLKQITEAYKKVADADFLLDPTTGAYPYQRYPRGVFVFLIYR